MYIISISTDASYLLPSQAECDYGITQIAVTVIFLFVSASTLRYVLSLLIKASQYHQLVSVQTTFFKENIGCIYVFLVMQLRRYILTTVS